MEANAAVTVANAGARVVRSDGNTPQQPKQQPQQVEAVSSGPILTGFSLTAAPAKDSQSATASNGARQTLSSAVGALPQQRSDNAAGSVTRMTVSVAKKGSRLGFGVRHDRAKRLVVSTVVGQSTLCEGDTLVSVNGLSLDGLEFLAIVEHLKALPPGKLVFDIERPAVVSSRPVAKGNSSGALPSPPAPSSVSRTFPPAPTILANASAMSHAMPTPMANGQATNGVRPAITSAAMPLATAAALASASMAGLIPAATPAMTNTSGMATPITLSTAIPIQSPVSPGTPLMPGQPPLKKPRVNSASGPTASPPVSALKTNVAINSGALHVAPIGGIATATPPEKKPPTVNALMKELEKMRAEKASLENKSAGLRKRLQQMLIDCDEARVRARAEVQTVKEKAQREVEEAQRALAEARAQLRLADRAPDLGRNDSIVYDLEVARTQIEKLKQADSERMALLNARYSMENRLAEREARRLLEALIADGCAQLRVIARRHTSSNSVASGSGTAGGDTSVVTIIREGVRRLAFLKFFELPHDFLHYMSPSYQSLDVIRHEVGRDQLADLFGSSMRHEERAGLFFVAAAPMDATFDPRTETLTLKCGWVEQNAIRKLARNFRF